MLFSYGAFSQSTCKRYWQHDGCITLGMNWYLSLSRYDIFSWSYYIIICNTQFSRLQFFGNNYIHLSSEAIQSKLIIYVIASLLRFPRNDFLLFLTDECLRKKVRVENDCCQCIIIIWETTWILLLLITSTSIIIMTDTYS